jgi:hypothetical protein
MTFVNTYTPTYDEAGEVILADLEISKTVTGEFGDMLRNFDFTIAFTAPAVPTGATLPTTIMGQIVGADGENRGTAIDLIANPTWAMANGEKMVIAGVPVGTTFQVTEAATPEYQPSAAVTAGSVTNDSYTAETGAQLATGGYFMTNHGAGNSVGFTNDHQTTAITGLVIASMPVVIALALAALAMAMLMASRNRRRIETMSLYF